MCIVATMEVVLGFGVDAEVVGKFVVAVPEWPPAFTWGLIAVAEWPPAVTWGLIAVPEWPPAFTWGRVAGCGSGLIVALPVCAWGSV